MKTKHALRNMRTGRAFAAVVSSVILALLALPGTARSEENAIFDFAVENDPNNALRMMATWKTILPADGMVEYREREAGEDWRATPICANKTTKHRFTIVELRAASDYEFRPVSCGMTGATLSASTAAMPDYLPKTALAVANQGPDRLGLTITGMPYPICSIVAVNEDGEIEWYHHDSDGGDPGAFWRMSDGRLAYATRQKIKAVDYMGNERILLNIEGLGEYFSHDFLITDRGTCIYITQTSASAYHLSWCSDDIVERDAGGKELWRWRCGDHADELGGFRISNAWQTYTVPLYGFDWTHANSIDLQTDSSGKQFIIFSLRNMNRVIGIDYPDGTIRWQLGDGLDFRYTGAETNEAEWFLCQHSARRTSDGAILLFDNGNDRCNDPDRNSSRALIYEVNDTDMTARIRWSYEFGSLAEHSGNSVQLPSGNILLAFPCNSTLSYAALIEADSSANTIWQTDFDFTGRRANNFIIGILRISSLYDMASAYCESDEPEDLTVFDDNTAKWYALRIDGSLKTHGVAWGWPGAVIVPGDYNGDRVRDLAVFDGATGLWFIISLDGELLAWAVRLGWAGAKPVPGDYDGDGCHDLAVFDGASGKWYIVSLNGSVLAWATAWGWPGAQPVMGDYDGDGKSDLAVFDGSGAWFIKSLNDHLLAWQTAWGWPGAVAVPGDYDGDGIDDLALFDDKSGRWFILSLDGRVLAWATEWGWAGATPLSGDYDGDGRNDLALFDDNAGEWYIVSLDGNVLAWATAWGWPGMRAVAADAR